MMALMGIDDRVNTNAGTIDDLENKVKTNIDGIGMNSAGIGALDTRIMGLDSDA